MVDGFKVVLNRMRFVEERTLTRDGMSDADKPDISYLRYLDCLRLEFRNLRQTSCKAYFECNRTVMEPAPSYDITIDGVRQSRCFTTGPSGYHSWENRHRRYGSALFWGQWYHLMNFSDNTILTIFWLRCSWKATT